MVLPEVTHTHTHKPVTSDKVSGVGGHLLSGRAEMCHGFLTDARVLAAKRDSPPMKEIAVWFLTRESSPASVTEQ